jgi:hypothetical protein
MSVRRSVVADLPVPEDVFPHSPDLFLGLVLPFLTEVAIVEAAATAYVYHGDNLGLFRSSAVNRATYERQMAYIRHVVEERFGVRFLRYGGRSIYGGERDRRGGPGRVADYIRECRSIAAAGVDPAIKRRSQAKLAASLLPDALYVMLRALKAQHRDWRSRQFRRRIAGVRP